MLFVACKKETPKNPHEGVNISPPANPHAGMDMNQGGDPHAGMNAQSGMAGMFGAPTPDFKAEVSPDGKITVGKLAGKLPKSWKSVPPTSAMRLAQVELPPVKGDPEPGELTLFYLGTDAGGIEANIDRWCAQFSQPDGKPTKDLAKRETLTIGSLKATLVSFTGSMNASAMPGAPQKGAHSGWMNLSAIVETPDGPFFFKGTGPEKTMQGQVGAMKAFLKSLSFGG